MNIILFELFPLLTFKLNNLQIIKNNIQIQLWHERLKQHFSHMNFLISGLKEILHFSL